MDNVERIKKKFPLLFDGAMGTYYRDKSKKPLPECEMANIFDGELIEKIHMEYICSGAKAIKTNTFGANKGALRCSDSVLRSVIESGYKIARDSVKKSGKDVEIFADIGPISYNEEDEDKVYEEYKEIADIFIELGAKNFLFETFDESRFLHKISKYIKYRVGDSFIIVSFALNPDGYTRKGYLGEELLGEFSNVEYVNACGLNCVSGPAYILKTLDSIHLPNKHISIMPNSSYPTVVNNRIFYSDNSSYFSSTMLEFLSRGVEIIGGCCGTTPEHIEKISKAIVDFKIGDRIENTNINCKVITKPTTNLFYEKLSGGKKTIAVELDPPADVDIEKYMKNAKKLKECGVDAITIADCPVGRARIDSSLMAYKIKNEVGIDPVVHLTCRDRNLNATKALLLGLNVENIRNLIIVTGDPIPNAEKDEIKPVFNFNSRLLSKYISDLNERVFTNKMVISAGLNINARNFELELNKAIKKVECGVEVFYTQPVVSENAVKNLKKAKETLRAKIMGGIIPIVSHRNAVFMNEEISGIRISDEIIKKYEGKTKEECTHLAVDISLDFMKKIEEYIDGFYLITPFNRVDIIEKIIEGYRGVHL